MTRRRSCWIGSLLEAGIARNPALASRSSFNFVPEGEYSLSKALREELVAGGFEIGVHDLKHDGSLYRSKKAFDAAVPSINRYLNEWDAVGFRAGFMFHNLEWLRDLKIEYDASTFDTDPFEPQPEGVGTIFPFWVAGRNPGKGYVEMPYTLPQDATLFLILRDKAIAIWQDKLAWLAKHGGMVLLNVHPDYLAFNSEKATVSEFDPKIYERFLQHVKTEYAGSYWHALPREVAAFCREQMAPPMTSSYPGSSQ